MIKRIIIAALAIYLIYRLLFLRDMDKPPVYVTKHFHFGYNGYIIPAFGIVLSEKSKDSKELYLHEKMHWDQYRREGFFPFVFNYCSAALKYGYEKNPYEIEARYREDFYCQNNYTECVRNGLAKTADNPNFKKY